jgi:hypothetical protein
MNSQRLPRQRKGRRKETWERASERDSLGSRGADRSVPREMKRGFVFEGLGWYAEMWRGRAGGSF